MDVAQAHRSRARPDGPSATNRTRPIDQRISSALLHAYEERLRIGAQLSENGSASTKPCSIGSGTDNLGMGLGRSPLREPLDGKILLDIKQATDNHIRECTSALTRATAVLEEDTIRGAEELVDALVNTRATLEAQETNGEASSEAMGASLAPNSFARPGRGWGWTRLPKRPKAGSRPLRRRPFPRRTSRARTSRRASGCPKSADSRRMKVRRQFGYLGGSA